MNGSILAGLKELRLVKLDVDPGVRGGVKRKWLTSCLTLLHVLGHVIRPLWWSPLAAIRFGGFLIHVLKSEGRSHHVLLGSCLNDSVNNRQSPSQLPVDSVNNRQSPSQLLIDSVNNRQSPSQLSIDSVNSRQSPSQLPIDFVNSRQSPSQLSIDSVSNRQSPSQLPNDSVNSRQNPSQLPIDFVNSRQSPSQLPIDSVNGRGLPLHDSVNSIGLPVIYMIQLANFSVGSGEGLPRAAVCGRDHQRLLWSG